MEVGTPASGIRGRVRMPSCPDTVHLLAGTWARDLSLRRQPLSYPARPRIAVADWAMVLLPVSELGPWRLRQPRWLPHESRPATEDRETLHRNRRGVWLHIAE
jgi:hypothetical protein